MNPQQVGIVQNPLPATPGMVPRKDPDGYLVESKGVFEVDSPWLIIIGIVVGIIIIFLVIAFILSIFVDETADFQPINTIVIDNEINNTTGSSTDGSFSLNNGVAYGDMSSCETGPTREWTTGPSITFGSCDCIDPFFGSECFRESYNDTYTSIGTPAQADIIADFGSSMRVDRLSFPFRDNHGRLPNSTLSGDDLTFSDTTVPTETICTQMCDQDSTCTGVWWIQAEPPSFGIDQPEDQKPQCQLITGQVVVRPGANIPYSSAMDSILYMKKDFEPQFKDRVFVYQGEKPLRYWLVDTYSSPFGDNRSQTMFDRQLIKFDWRPQILINSTGCTIEDVTMGPCPFGERWYGFFSNRSINLTDNVLLKQLIDNSSTGPIIINGQEYVVIRPGNSQLNFPSSWREIWGSFVDPSTIPGVISQTSPTISITDNDLSLSDIVSTQTSRSVGNNNLIPNIITPARRNNLIYNQPTGQIITQSVNHQSNRTHDLDWSRFSFPSNGEGKLMTINIGDRINFQSRDQDYHDLVSTDEDWYIINAPVNIGVSNPFQTTVPFNTPGRYFFKDRMNPRLIRLTVQVDPTQN